MIRATFSRRPDGTCTGFTLTGHAGSGEYGKDIVCAAVSALAIHTANAIERYTKTPVKSEARSGYLKLRFREAPDEKADLLVRAFAESLRELQTEYGSEYLTIADEEV